MSSINDTEFVAFDLETTGLSPAFDRIVEVGAVRFRADGTELDRKKPGSRSGPIWQKSLRIAPMTSTVREVPPPPPVDAGDQQAAACVGAVVWLLRRRCRRGGTA